MINEWLLTNGLGGFAMGASAPVAAPSPDAGSGPSAAGRRHALREAHNRGDNARRYHGLLIAATSPPVGRVLALHSIIDRVTLSAQPQRSYDLSTHAFAPNDPHAAPVLHPGGWRHLVNLQLQPPQQATWRYRVNGVHLTRTLKLLRGRNAVELCWALDKPLEAGQRAQLFARPLTPLRDFHALGTEGDQPAATLLDPRTLLLSRHGMSLRMELSSGSWTLDQQWWRNFHYEEDRLRGQRCSEDVPSAATFEADLAEPLTLRCEMIQPSHRAVVAIDTPSGASPAQRLRTAAEQFVVQRKMRDASGGWSTSIIAGYPWFSDWGRDTMIALPGLLLCTGRIEQAQATLMTFARNLRNGLIPNRFDDYAGAAHYNTVDASLWFIHAVHALHQRAGIVDAALLDACGAIILAYRHGTDYDIYMDSDGLIAAGSPQTQLTWMDAKRDGVTFTPRHGKAVEINALWHHALHCLAGMLSDATQAAELRDLAATVAVSFRTAFWNDARSCCHDVLSPDADQAGIWQADDAVRPNQLFAVSLKFSPLTQMQQRGVVEIVRRRLLTPFGVRTLEPGHPQYRGRYEGDLMQRDGAYHQGTVWPWLIGPYCEALLRTGEFSSSAKAEVMRTITPLLGELDNGCFGQIAEVYDGDPPHRPSGCPAQAWSVAELLRVMAMFGRDER